MRMAVEQDASDLHLKAGRPPVLRVEGEVRFTDLPALDAEKVHSLGLECMTAEQQKQYLATGTLDFAYMLETGDRFRLNVFRQLGQTSVAARRVTRYIPTFEELNLPVKPLEKMCQAMQGLVIFAGITGCGKSTSIAACLGLINTQRRCHIVTIEDPIEFLFEDKQSFINQREVGTDVPDFSSAMRTLLREDPDVVLIGEMRDRDTFETAMRVAETGHLIFTTIHASSAPGVVTRILDLYPNEAHKLIRRALGANLVAVVCQNLIPSLLKDV